MGNNMLALLLLLSTDAHVGAVLEGIDLALPGPSIEANFGLLASEDGRAFSWVCHEVITAPGAVIAPRYTRNSLGHWLVTVPALAQARDVDEPVYRSTDLCDWDTVDGLEGLTITRVFFDPHDDQVAFALTADLGDRTNGIYRSTDGGSTFAIVPGTEGTERLFRTIEADPLRPGHIQASAVWYASNEAWLFSSDDHGATWRQVPVPLPDTGQALDVDVATVHDGVSWVIVGPYGADTLLRTDDGGDTFTTVLQAEVDLLDAAVDDDGVVWVTGLLRSMFRSDAGGHVFTPFEGPPGGYGVAAADGQLWATGFAEFTGVALTAYDPDTDTFVQALHLMELEGPPACPADSAVATICEPLWPALRDRVPQPFVDTGTSPFTDDTATPVPSMPADGAEAKGGCGCASGAPMAGLWLWLPLWLRRRR